VRGGVQLQGPKLGGGGNGEILAKWSPEAIITVEGTDGGFERKPLIALEFGDEWSVNNSRG